MAQTLTGRNLRWYLDGLPVGFGRMTMLKPSTTTGLDVVKEAGNPRVVEYVKKVPETSISFGYNVFSKGQLAVAIGQGLGSTSTSINGQTASGTVGHVPYLPDNMDCVERRIKPGTEGLGAGEIVTGYTLYQKIMVEKDDYDQEVDKIVARSLSAKCDNPYDFEGNNGIAFDRFTGNNVLNSFVLTQKSIGLQGGNLTIRVESPYQTFLKEGVDYTATNGASTTTITFTTPPASSSVPNIVVVYPW